MEIASFHTNNQEMLDMSPSVGKQLQVHKSDAQMHRNINHHKSKCTEIHSINNTPSSTKKNKSSTHFDDLDSKKNDIYTCKVLMDDWMCFKCHKGNKRNKSKQCMYCSEPKEMKKLKQYSVHGFCREFISVMCVLNLVDTFLEFHQTQKSITLTRQDTKMDHNKQFQSKHNRGKAQILQKEVARLQYIPIADIVSILELMSNRSKKKYDTFTYWYFEQPHPRSMHQYSGRSSAQQEHLRNINMKKEIKRLKKQLVAKDKQINGLQHTLHTTRKSHMHRIHSDQLQHQSELHQAKHDFDVNVQQAKQEYHHYLQQQQIQIQRLKHDLDVYVRKHATEASKYHDMVRYHTERAQNLQNRLREYSLGAKFHYLYHQYEFMNLWRLSVGYEDEQSTERFNQICSNILLRYKSQRGLLRVKYFVQHMMLITCPKYN
eukprot:299819_1